MILNSICIYVTFVDELTKLEGKTVSLVSIMNEEHEQERTFKIRRQSANGMVYAKTLADKYDLTYDKIKERLSRKIQEEQVNL